MIRTAITIKIDNRSYTGEYTHSHGVLTVTAYGDDIEKAQCTVQHYGHGKARAEELLIKLVQSGKIDPDL